jgi:hypothetical protein
MEQAYRKQSDELASLHARHAALQKRERHFTFQAKQLHALESRLAEQTAQANRATKEAQVQRQKQEVLQAANAEIRTQLGQVSAQLASEKQQTVRQAERSNELSAELQRANAELYDTKAALVLSQAKSARGGSIIHRTSLASQRSEAALDVSELERLLRESRHVDTPPTVVMAANRRALELLARLRAQVDVLQREHRATQDNEKSLLMMLIKLQEKKATGHR